MYTGNMIILLHVMIALTSLILAGYTFVRPSRKSLAMSYVMMAATLGSGMYLVASAPAHMIEACLMGVAYLTVVSAMTIAAQVRLVHKEANASYIK